MAATLPGSLTPETFERRQALEEFESLPWPSRTDEEWRRTDPALLPISGAGISAPVSSAFTVAWEGVSPDLIRQGVIVTNLKTALTQFPRLLEEYLFQTGRPEGLKKFVSLHRALWEDGLFCYVPEGVRVETPLRTSIRATSEGPLLFPHLLIVAGPGAELTLIDERCSERNGSEPLFSDEMVEIVLKAGANLKYIRLQKWSPSVSEIFTQRVTLEGAAQFMNLAVGLGGHLTKANIETILAGTGCRCDLLGIFFGTEFQHFDFHTLQDHTAQHTASDLLYKSALKDRARYIYTGLIRIRKEAQKSDAYQANRNLLLSQGAKADSIPMLEIEADDVRCTHGVAVGPVDEEQAFYLMSRGMTPEEAQRLIVEGFFEQVFARIPVTSVREELLDQVQRRL